MKPEEEISPIIGSKEGIVHRLLALLNPGDSALIPDPCYPPYRNGVILAGAGVITMPLKENNGFLPDLSKIPSSQARRAKLLFINYPNNPTGAVCDIEFFKDVVRFAKKFNIIVCHDAAYTELSFDGFKPPSLLEVKGAREVGCEFHSFSKTYNMTGWRIGWISGNKNIAKALATIKTNIDSGIFTAIQRAAIAAFDLPREHARQQESQAW